MEILGQLFRRAHDALPQFRMPARFVNQSAQVAQVVADFAGNQVAGVSRKLDAFVGVIAVNRFDEADITFLHQIFNRFTRRHKTTRAIIHQRRVH